MACSSCGKKKRKKSAPVVYSGVSVPTSYKEGQDGFTEIIYLGESTLRIRGRKTGKHYFFGAKAVRVVDSNDAQFFVKRYDFEYVKSNSSGTEHHTETSTQDNSVGDGRVSEIDE